MVPWTCGATVRVEVRYDKVLLAIGESSRFTGFFGADRGRHLAHQVRLESVRRTRAARSGDLPKRRIRFLL